MLTIDHGLIAFHFITNESSISKQMFLNDCYYLNPLVTKGSLIHRILRENKYYGYLKLQLLENFEYRLNGCLWSPSAPGGEKRSNQKLKNAARSRPYNQTWGGIGMQNGVLAEGRAPSRKWASGCVCDWPTKVALLSADHGRDMVIATSTTTADCIPRRDVIGTRELNRTTRDRV